MSRLYCSKKFRQLPRRSESKNFPSSKMELFVTMTQKGSSFTSVAEPLDLPMYKRKTEEPLKVP